MAGKITSRPENIPDTPGGVVAKLQSSENRKLRLRKIKKRLRFYMMLVGVFVVLAGYFSMPVSRVSTVSVSGLHNLTNEYIVEISGLTPSTDYYLTVPYLIERKIKSDPMVESASVSLENENTVRIIVKEKKAIGYRYEDEPVILLADNTKAPLKSEYLEMIANLPLITGFESAEQTRLLSKGLANVKTEVIEDISEITQYSLQYDDEAVRVLMRNGGNVIANYYSMEMLNQFNAIYTRMPDRTMCIFAPEDAEYAYTKVCPWNEESEEREFWLDLNGEIMRNKYGDPVYKRYYTDADGNYALDEEGNKIPIPVDENGIQLRDEDFIEHYEEGLYASGTLVFPEE